MLSKNTFNSHLVSFLNSWIFWSNRGFNDFLNKVWDVWSLIGKLWIVITVPYWLQISYEGSYVSGFFLHFVQLDNYLFMQNEVWYTNKILVFFSQAYIDVCKAENVLSAPSLFEIQPFSANSFPLCICIIYFPSLVLEYVSMGNYTM